MRFGVQLLRATLMALALLVTIGLGLGPASAQTGGGFNPTASAVKEEQLLRELNKLEGRVSIPDGKASLLEQPQGRSYRGFREGALVWIGAIAILGMLLALAWFYFSKGPIAMETARNRGRRSSASTASSASRTGSRRPPSSSWRSPA